MISDLSNLLKSLDEVESEFDDLDELDAFTLSPEEFQLLEESLYEYASTRNLESHVWRY